VIPSSSLVPENDPSVLFTTAGMQQFKRYYLFPDEAPSSRIATCQKCVRTGDIDEVGDRAHLTFFEMLGNFSFGYEENVKTQNSKLKSATQKSKVPYFKQEAILWGWEFLTQELGIEKSRIYATYFDGDDKVPADNESLEILKKIDGLSKIEPQGFDDNFWSLGTEDSPGGPTVEFYVSPSEVLAKGDVDNVEIWNLVFNEFVLKNGKYEPTELKGVDTGMGLERLSAVMQGKSDVYQTDLFAPIISEIEKISGKKYEEDKKTFRIIADHIKSAVFLSSEGVQFSNTNQGYVLRRLVRRAIRYGWTIDIKSLKQILSSVSEIYKGNYSDLGQENVLWQIGEEEDKFRKTIEEGLKKAKDVFDKKTPIFPEIYSKIMQLDDKGEALAGVYSGEKEGICGVSADKIKEASITGNEAFNLYQTDGFPIEMIVEMAREKKLFVDIRGFRDEMERHQKLSRTSSSGMFKGGLADNKIETTRLHTAAHLLLAALREVLGEQVEQKGSNITEERLRFDFNNPEKLTPEQIEQVENIVNEKIIEGLEIVMQEMNLEEAKKSGATGSFSDRYGDIVKVYSIGGDPSTRTARSGSTGKVFSVEICGGPHVANTSELGYFKIIKEESSSSGVRRIKAVLE